MILQTQWLALGSVTLFEELCHWHWALRFQKTPGIPSSLYLLLVDKDISSRLLLQPHVYLLAAMPFAIVIMDASPLKPELPINLFYKLPQSDISSQQ